MKLRESHDPQCMRRNIKTCAWCPARDVLAIAFEDGDLSLYRLWEEACVLEENVNQDKIVWSPNGKLVAFMDSSSGDCTIYDIQTCKLASTFQYLLRPNELISMIDWCPALEGGLRHVM